MRDQQIPPAPPRDRRMRRYPMPMVTLARRMYGNGDSWTPSQIRDYLERNHGAQGLSLMTVRCWVVPGAAEEQRRRNADSYARRVASPEHRRVRASEDLLVWAVLLNQQLALMVMFAVAAHRAPPTQPSQAELDRVMLELRSERLSYPAISTVVERYHGVSMTEDQVRRRLRTLGVQPMQAKAEATRRHYALRRASTS